MVLDLNVPSTTQSHLRTLAIFFLNRPETKTGKKERKITEVERALQSTKENRTPEVEKLSGTQSKKKNKRTKTEEKKTEWRRRRKRKERKKTHKNELHKVLGRTKSP